MLSHLRGRELRAGRCPPSSGYNRAACAPDALLKHKTLLKTVNLRESTRDIISQVESLTGYPVEVIEDDALQTTAVVHMASRRTLPAHLIRYKATAGQPPDYLICHQCAFILRLFANPPEERFECGYAPAGYEAVRSLVQAHLGRQGVDQSAISRQAAERFLNATVVHLRSIPIGLRVSDLAGPGVPGTAALAARPGDERAKAEQRELSTRRPGPPCRRKSTRR